MKAMAQPEIELAAAAKVQGCIYPDFVGVV